MAFIVRRVACCACTHGPPLTVRGFILRVGAFVSKPSLFECFFVCWVFLVLMNKLCKRTLSFRTRMKYEINRLRPLRSGGHDDWKTSESRPLSPAASWMCNRRSRIKANVSSLRKWWTQSRPVSFQSDWSISSSHRENYIIGSSLAWGVFNLCCRCCSETEYIQF